MNTLVPSNGNGNGHKSNAALEAAAAPGALPAVADVTWEPSNRDWQYLTAVGELLELDGRISDEKIANRLHVTRQAVTKMRRRPGFTAWVNSEIRRLTDDLWPKAVHRTAVLATRGSIDHFNALAKLRGEFREEPGAGPAANFNGPSVVFIHG